MGPWIVTILLIVGSAVGFYRYNAVVREYELGRRQTIIDTVKKALKEIEKVPAEEKSFVGIHNEIYEKVGEKRWENVVKGQTTFALMVALLNRTGRVLSTNEEITDSVKRDKKLFMKILEESAQPYINGE